jgi:hypothetical protein
LLTTVEVTLVGKTPLLLSSPATMLMDQDSEPAKKAKKLTREQEAELRAYRNEKGNLTFPLMAIRKNLILGSAGYKLPKKREGISSYLMHLRPVTVNGVTEEFAPILDGKGKPINNYIIDTRRAVNRNSKPPAGIVVHRPRIDKWRIVARFFYDPEAIPVDDSIAVLMQMWNNGGNRVGIGSFRPQCGGFFGLFDVDQIIEV